MHSKCGVYLDGRYLSVAAQKPSGRNPPQYGR